MNFILWFIVSVTCAFQNPVSQWIRIYGDIIVILAQSNSPRTFNRFRLLEYSTGVWQYMKNFPIDPNCKNQHTFGNVILCILTSKVDIFFNNGGIWGNSLTVVEIKMSSPQSSSKTSKRSRLVWVWLGDGTNNIVENSFSLAPEIHGIVGTCTVLNLSNLNLGVTRCLARL